MAPLVLLLRLDWHRLAGMAFGGFALALVSLAIFGSQVWLEWLAALPSRSRASVDLNVLQYVITPASFGPKLHLPMLPWLLAGIGLAIFAVFSTPPNNASLLPLTKEDLERTGVPLY